jgi:histidine decarboxylase
MSRAWPGRSPTDDTTLMGSRNGHAVLAVWTRLMGHGTLGFRRDAEGCRQRAESLAEDLRAQGVQVLLNPFSLTVLFPEPDPATVKRFQLSCSGGQAHAIVMPNVGDAQVRRFRETYLAWWETAAGGRAITGEVTNVQESGTIAAS